MNNSQPPQVNNTPAKKTSAWGCIVAIILFIWITKMACGGSHTDTSSSSSPTTPTETTNTYSSGNTSSDNSTTTTEPTIDSSDDLSKHISGDQWFGCTDKVYFGKIVDYAVQKDEEAFKQALSAGIIDGTCTLFSNGETVYIVDTSIFSGMVKVRRKGETTEYWTNIEAVK